MDDQPESLRTLDDRIVASLGVGVMVVDLRGEPRLANNRARTLLGGPAEGAAVGEATAVRTLLAAVADLPGDGWKEVVVVVAGEARVLGVRVATLVSIAVSMLALLCSELMARVVRRRIAAE